MSHLALRRVMIRLLHDPDFAAALYEDTTQTLAAVDLTATERAWLTAQPPAVWRTDPARPIRVLTALAEEYPVSVTRATAHAAAFLQSPQFHGAIQARGSLALAFGEHLALAPDFETRCLARLERAIAQVRRAPRVPAASPAGRLRLSPRAVMLRLPSGALALLEALRRGAAGETLGPDDEAVLVVAPPSAGEVTLESLEPALATMLERAADGCSRADLLAETRRQGADEGEAVAIVERLVAEGVLR